MAVLALTNRELMQRFGGGLGRRGVMIFGGAVFLVGAVLKAAAEDWALLSIGCILLDVGIVLANEALGNMAFK